MFWDDATTDYGFFKGGPDDFVAMAQNALKDHLSNHHMMGQAFIEVEGDVAFGEVYFQAFHRVIMTGMEKDLFISGRYVDRYKRRDGCLEDRPPQRTGRLGAHRAGGWTIGSRRARTPFSAIAATPTSAINANACAPFEILTFRRNSHEPGFRHHRRGGHRR